MSTATLKPALVATKNQHGNWKVRGQGPGGRSGNLGHLRRWGRGPVGGSRGVVPEPLGQEFVGREHDGGMVDRGVRDVSPLAKLPEGDGHAGERAVVRGDGPAPLGRQFEAGPVDRLDREQFVDAFALLGLGPVQVRAA